MTNNDNELPQIDIDTLIGAIPMPTLIIDEQRRVRAANRSAQRALEVSTTGDDLALAIRSPGLLEAVDHTLTSLERSVCEVQLGASPALTYEVSVSPLDIGRARYALIVFIDVTSARQGDAVRSAFVANVSHELRSPLTTLMGAAEALEGPAKDDEIGRSRMLALMGQEARRMKNLIDDLLSLSRVEIQEFIPPGQDVELRALLEGARERLTARASARDMTITMDIATDLPKIAGVDDELFQVFDNLISNAIKYGDPGSTVTVQAGQSKQELRISINNAGSPIPAEHLPRLTERFYRVDKSRSRELGGTGLGLAIVKHIVNRHRGKLQIESSAKQGTTFSVVLPLKL